MTYELTKVGINMSNLGTPDPINLSFPNTSSQFITEIPRKANEVTGGLFGVGVLITLFIILIKMLTDEFEGFRYSLVRGISLSSIICSIFGLFSLNVGYFTELYPVVLFMAIALLSTLWVLIEET
jgi:hypothetical protein